MSRYMDNVLVFGAIQEQYDLNLMAVLKQLEAASVTLNPAKCEFSKTSVKFLGHFLDKNGISADPNKTETVLHMDAPQSVTNLRRFLCIVNQLGGIFFTFGLPESTIKRVTILKKCVDMGSRARASILQCQGRTYSPYCASTV